MRPDISVVIPTWNRKEKLVRAVRSALAQECVSIEVLVCDDGSHDGTVELFANWPDARVRLIRGPRSGLPAAPRNRGLSVANGEWIAFLDDDDYWLPQKSQQQLSVAKRYGFQAVASNALRVINDIETGDTLLPPHLPIFFTLADLIKNNLVIASSAMLHRSLLGKIGEFPEAMALKAYEDYALWLRASFFENFGYIDTPLVYYSDMPSNSVRATQPDDQKAKMHVFKNWFNWAKGSSFTWSGALVAKQFFMTALSPTYLRSIYGIYKRQFLRKP